MVLSVSEESAQQRKDAAWLDQLEKQNYRDPRTDFAPSFYKTTVLSLLVFIARKLNKPYLDIS